MHYVVDVQPWLRIQPPADESEEVAVIDSELGRSFVVEAKSQARAIARVVRDCVSIRKASAAELIKAGANGETILSDADPEPGTDGGAGDAGDTKPAAPTGDLKFDAPPPPNSGVGGIPGSPAAVQIGTAHTDASKTDQFLLGNHSPSNVSRNIEAF